jgi:hypothetical protein
MADLLDVVKGVATVALIAFATRWVTLDKGPDAPKIEGTVAIYRIRWPVRAAAYTAAALFLVFAFADLRGDLTGRRWLVLLLFVTLALGAVWFGTGVVTLDETAISKRFLWHSSSLRWDEISEIRLHKRDGGAIELRGNGKNLIVDSRFVAPAYLRRALEQRTKLQALRD